MSCQIKGIANLTNTSNIKELLFGDTTRRREFLRPFALSFTKMINFNQLSIFMLSR